MHPAADSREELLAACSRQQFRRSGPGGQHRNKVETGIRLLHEPSGVSAEATERRSQGDNLTTALRRLRRNLALEVRGELAAAAPSAKWRSRRKKGRIRVNGRHEDFPALLAEALDVMNACDWDLSRAGSLLGVTNSQLVRFLKIEPRALALLNRQRAERGQRPLR